MNQIAIKHHLNLTFLQRTERNPNYSLRAFGRDLEIDPSLLSRLMKGKRKFSRQMVKRISSELQVPLDHVVESKSSRQHRVSTQRYLGSHDFNPLSKWYFFAILELFHLSDFKSDSKWIARKINLSSTETEAALQVLHEMGHIDLSGPQWQVITTNTNWTHYEITSREKQNYQKQILDKAKNAIDKVDFKLRDSSSLTIAMSVKLVPEIKRRIESFNQELRTLITEHGHESEVYQFSLSCFPLTQSEALISKKSGEKK